MNSFPLIIHWIEFIFILGKPFGRDTPIVPIANQGLLRNRDQLAIQRDIEDILLSKWSFKLSRKINSWRNVCLKKLAAAFLWDQKKRNKKISISKILKDFWNFDTILLCSFRFARSASCGRHNYPATGWSPSIRSDFGSTQQRTSSREPW